MLVRLLSFTVAVATVVSAKLNDPQERKLVTYDNCFVICDSFSGSATCDVYADDRGRTPIGTLNCNVEDCSPQVGFGGATCTGVDLSVCTNIVVDGNFSCSINGDGDLECPANCTDPPCVEGDDCSSDGDCCTLADGTGQTCVEKKIRGVTKDVCVKVDTSDGDKCASCGDCGSAPNKCFKGNPPCCT